MSLLDTLKPDEFLQVSYGMGHYTLYWRENEILCKLRWCNGWPPTNDKIRSILNNASISVAQNKMKKILSFKFHEQEPSGIIKY
jgi:hypothetical protein